jgi:DNA-binding MarR family transcriptional regulator
MLKELLGVTDGNLASHTKALESEEYIAIEKQFIGKKPNTRYLATKLGKSAFRDHIEALEKLIQKGY